VSSHSLTRAERSPAVGAVKAPPVIWSNWAISVVFVAGVDGTWSLCKEKSKKIKLHFRRELSSVRYFYQ
jgi:hypothetical protein